MTGDDHTLAALIQRCLDRGYSVEIVRCGQYAKPGAPYLCRVSHSHGMAARDHLVYGNDAPAMLKDAMEHVTARGFTQEQDRYGLGKGK